MIIQKNAEGDINAWFEKARFGLFVHWGIYAILGRGEQALFREHLDQSEYRRLARRFDPPQSRIGRWLELAATAGMKYAVLTAKHHDGFCLFESKASEFTAAATGRDLIAEYVEACRKHGIRVGIYYSLADWSKPAYFSGPKHDPEGFGAFIDYTHQQVHELCANYGQIDLLWFDGGWPYGAEQWRSEELDDAIRALQPKVLINDRLHGGGGGNVAPAGDYGERTSGYFQTFEQRGPAQTDRPVETERTMGVYWWGYLSGERRWKSARDIVGMLVEAASHGSNLLLNVGPLADGTLPDRCEQALDDIAPWIRANGESIYGTGAGVLECSTLGASTVGDSCVYLHILAWPGAEARVYGLENRVTGVYQLWNDEPVSFSQDGLELTLRGLPSKDPDPFCSVLRIETIGSPREHESVTRLWSERRDLSDLAKWSEEGMD